MTALRVVFIAALVFYTLAAFALGTIGWYHLRHAVSVAEGR